MKKFQNRFATKLFFTFVPLIIYRLGNYIPLPNFDQIALQKILSENLAKNNFFQLLNIYSSGTTNILSPFSLGIVPFINASIIIDLFTSIIPFFEKLQSEEGKQGQKQLILYKKILSLVFACLQSYFLLQFLKNFLYESNTISLVSSVLELTAGSFCVVWLSSLIENRGIGNGTSIIILFNILVSVFEKIQNVFQNFTIFLIPEICIIIFLILIINVSQKAKFEIELVSARQLKYLENEKESKRLSKKNTLPIRYNQAGIFPLIIASNFLGFISYFDTKIIFFNSIVNNLLYYFLIIFFNYFYTKIIWDPEKISEQLRKASVSIANKSPGKETTEYLENVVKFTSLRGGIILCMILLTFDLIKLIFPVTLLSQLNISSIIIAIGIINEIARNIKSLRITKVLNRIFLI